MNCRNLSVVLARMVCGACLVAAAALPVRGEVILQYFGTTWNDMADRIPELAEAGYNALWLPPPFKGGAGAWDVGFGTHDRFDLGDKDQMGSVPTLYGTKDDFLNLMRVAHRFGMRVYFDNVMAHNGGPIPGYDANTSIYAQPGFVPEDFHLVVNAEGNYRKASDSVDYQDEWQVLHRNPFGTDIAQESPNASFGTYEGASFPKWVGVRHPDNPEYYLDTDIIVGTNYEGGAVYTFGNKEPFQDVGYAPGNIGAGNRKFDWNDTNGNDQHDVGEASEPFTDTGLDGSRPGWNNVGFGYGDGKYNMGNIVAEDVNTMLFRAVRWFTDVAKADGYRLDAVKHVPFYFFGKTYGGDRDYVNWGYNGQIQEQHNITHGFSDWNNHRDTCFNDRNPRDDALLYGEHLGTPPAQGPYLDSGMRIAQDSYMNSMSYAIGNNLTGLDAPGYGTWGVDTGMKYITSHDQAFFYGDNRPAAYAVMIMSAGLPIIYTDGYNQAGPPNWFPKPAYTPFLGQFGATWMRNQLDVHREFARGDQIAKWGDGTLVAFERRDKRDNGGMSDADGTVLFFALVRPWAGGGRDLNSINTTFPEGATLVNHSHHGGQFKVQVQAGKIKDLGGGSVIVPENGYFAFSWANPLPPTVWDDGLTGEIYPIRFLQNGQPVGTVLMPRKDGRDGDANWNPHGLADTNSSDYTYFMPVPRITSGTNITIEARADGSAENIMLRIDGGMDLNSHMGLGPLTGDKRDQRPALANDVYLGYEQMRFIHRVREKFAAVDVSRNVIGSGGCETYVATVGVAGVTVNNGSGWNTGDGTVTWAYHSPTAMNETNTLQMDPAPLTAAGSNLHLWVKIGYAGQPQNVYVYYTTNGTSWPEGSRGVGKGATRVAAGAFVHWSTHDGTGIPDWWRATLPPMPAGTTLRYKIGVSHPNSGSVFPWSSSDIDNRRRMETFFILSNLNFSTIYHFPHNNYGNTETGLTEGIHFASTRSFLNRSGHAPIYKTQSRSFYFDTAPPSGQILYPANNGDTLYGSSYGAVVRGDRTVRDVWYRITDVNPGNDDTNTLSSNGNAAWVKATKVSANPNSNSPYPWEWRFDYVNIPASNSALIEVRFTEISSSNDFTLSDAQGHFTTLTRTVETRGPNYNLFVAWPQVDGQQVGPGYVAKAYFTKSLADGISSQNLINAFSVLVDSNLQDRALYGIIYNETFDYHALAFTMPNYYNGNADFLHELKVILERDGYPVLDARRNFKSAAIEQPSVQFLSPPLTDGAGDPYYIILPSVAVPVATQRQYEVQVETSTNVASLHMGFNIGSGTLVPGTNNPAPSTNGTLLTWMFIWQFPLTNNPSVIEGSYQLFANADTDGNTNTVEASAIRSASVLLRDIVNLNTNDVDNDDDGIPDFDEKNAKGLPSTPFTTWVNGDVHSWRIFGKTGFLLPDTDGDGLPDGLESGWRAPLAGTDTNIDTNADGWPNFLSDYDPPFYNTCDNLNKVPNISVCDQGDKAALVEGTMTDPANPDTDGDGLSDGVEDANRNGWVDGDGELLPVSWDPWLERDWPDGELGSSDPWTETDPNNGDTDDDGLSDGYGEDINANGRIDGDTNTNRVYDAGEAWTETNPLKKDTDGDGLPDGWESGYGLDPLDNGSDDLGTTNAADGVAAQGGSGDPDNDGFSNLAELISGTNPMVFNSGSQPPEGEITIGPKTNYVKVGGVSNNFAFTDWTYEHVIALDTYDELEGPYDGGDVYYRPWASDGFESSRDIVAFYAHDGGAEGGGGDGKFYFRLDLHDLKASAEASGLDIYVVVDTGNIGIGERKIVDSMDCITDMRWELTAVCYDGNAGAVYINTPGSPDTDELADTLQYSATNVVRRDQNAANGFGKAYFNSELDAVEFSISRQALLDAGWAGNFDQLNFQVFTTKDGTDGGTGELDGPDIRDSVRTDWIVNDFASTKNSDAYRYTERNKLTTLVQWVGVNADNDRGKRIKVVHVIHGNSSDRSAREMQILVNSGYSAGFHRPLDAHEAYSVPMALHITPLLAMGMEWASVDPARSPSWRDGKQFNQRIAGLIQSGLINLLGSTFSDHLLPYFTTEYNQDNEVLAREVLEHIYGAGAVSTSVFWTPERLLDSATFAKILALGYSATIIDQEEHLNDWFGRAASIGVDGYRINRIENVYCLPIANKASAQRFELFDSGPSMVLRKMFSKESRQGYWSGQHPQVMVFQSDWSDFSDYTRSANYDKLLRWMASKGWIQFVTPDQIIGGQIDISLPPNGSGDSWNNVNKGTGLGLAKTGHAWIQYAAQGNYDNWYLGSGLNEGLFGKNFNIRPGVTITQDYGMLYFGGIVSSAWNAVQSMSSSTNNLGRLARSVLHASTFESGFHDNVGSVNMTRFSTGDFAYPDASYDFLISFARYAQAQTRLAAIYEKVDDWASSVPTGTVAESMDVDLDGEAEYLLHNERVFALIERTGGRIIGTWVRDLLNNEVYQSSGNLVSYSDKDTEEEGTSSINPSGNVDARRTSLLKDQWAGTSAYINNPYSAINMTNGWQMISSNGAIRKTVMLAPDDYKLEVAYSLTGVLTGTTLYVRNGFSPDLWSLLLDGQEYLYGPSGQGGRILMKNTNYQSTVIAEIGYADAGHTTLWNSNAVDEGNGYTNWTVQMRNQAQTQQIELYGSGNFSFSLGFRAVPSDWDNDGMGNLWEDASGLNSSNMLDAAEDLDGDDVSNVGEYIAGTDGSISGGNDFPFFMHANPANTNGFKLRIPTESNRRYHLFYSNGEIDDANWQAANMPPLKGTGATVEWTDNGTATTPHPATLTSRVYRIDVRLP